MDGLSGLLGLISVWLIWQLSHGAVPVNLMMGMAGLSFLTFALYGYDKWQARRAGARIRETTLHLLALAGGWPGAWLGQIVWRHKTRKWAFRLTALLVAALNMAAITWLLPAVIAAV